MSALDFHAIEASLHDAGAPGVPTAILAREVPLYEVEFAALECAEERKLRSADWATLALARALGRISPALVDEYLGLGDTVSEAAVHRLLGDQLLQHFQAEPATRRRRYHRRRRRRANCIPRRHPTRRCAS